MSVTIKDVQDVVDEYADQSYVQGYEAAEARIIEILNAKLVDVSGGVFDAKGVIRDLLTEIKENK
jgi:hypothetical protein